MVPFDWRVLDRLGSIWRTYIDKGVRLSPEEHSLTVIVPATAAGATSPEQTLAFPMEGQFVWWGSAAVVIASDAGTIIIQTDNTTFELQPQLPTLLIRNGQNGRLYARHRKALATDDPSGFAPIASIAGTGSRPYILPFPVFFNPADFLVFQLFNGFAIPISLQFTLLGWKLTV